MGPDLVNPRWMYLKAALFVGIAVLSGGLLLLDAPTLRTGALLGVLVWSACRAYFFAFSVLERYVDPSFKYAGLGSLVSYLLKRR